MPSKHDFLELSYENIGFLVNRDQFFSSIYLDEDSQFTEYNGEKLFTFNLDGCLKEDFNFNSSEKLRLALICDISSYQEINKQRFSIILNDFADKTEISNKYISLKIGSQAEINAIPLTEIKMIPAALKEFQVRRGVLGVRFTGSGFAQFLIDIEQLVFNSLFKERILE